MFLFVAACFLNKVAECGRLVIVLVAVAAVICLYGQPGRCLSLFGAFLFNDITVLAVTTLLSLLRSPSTNTDVGRVFGTVVRGALLYAVTVPVVLESRGERSIRGVIFFSFVDTLNLHYFSRLVACCGSCRRKVVPFTSCERHDVSSSVIFLFPTLLGL